MENEKQKSEINHISPWTYPLVLVSALMLTFLVVLGPRPEATEFDEYFKHLQEMTRLLDEQSAGVRHVTKLVQEVVEAEERRRMMSKLTEIMSNEPPKRQQPVLDGLHILTSGTKDVYRSFIEFVQQWGTDAEELAVHDTVDQTPKERTGPSPEQLEQLDAAALYARAASKWSDEYLIRFNTVAALNVHLHKDRDSLRRFSEYTESVNRIERIRATWKRLPPPRGFAYPIDETARAANETHYLVYETYHDPLPTPPPARHDETDEIMVEIIRTSMFGCGEVCYAHSLGRGDNTFAWYSKCQQKFCG